MVALVEADQATLLARPYFAGGDPGPIIAALAQVPEMLGAKAPFLGRVLGPACLPARLVTAIDQVSGRLRKGLA